MTAFVFFGELVSFAQIIMSKPFRFKQFEIHQDKCAMKIGTDGVTLGAWAFWEDQPKYILDIGAGTGLISLMLAQRTKNAQITGIELDFEASEQAKKNAAQSKYSDRVNILHTSLQEFEAIQPFDLILSNPPFFTINERMQKDSRQIARQTNTLSFEALLKHTNRLLSKDGHAYFIIPYQREAEFLELGKANGIYPTQITHVQGNISSAIKRSLLKLSKKESNVDYDTMVIESERHVYTEAYSPLVKDFYLHL